jgi:hypothetical protein
MRMGFGDISAVKTARDAGITVQSIPGLRTGLVIVDNEGYIFTPTALYLESDRPRIAAVRVVDMSSSNAWAELAGVFCRTRSAFLEHESAKSELKGLMPEDAKEAMGHGIWAKRSKSGAVSFDVLSQEAAHAPLQ